MAQVEQGDEEEFLQRFQKPEADDDDDVKDSFSFSANDLEDTMAGDDPCNNSLSSLQWLTALQASEREPIQGSEGAKPASPRSTKGPSAAPSVVAANDTDRMRRTMDIPASFHHKGLPSSVQAGHLNALDIDYTTNTIKPPFSLATLAYLALSDCDALSTAGIDDYIRTNFAFYSKRPPFLTELQLEMHRSKCFEFSPDTATWTLSDECDGPPDSIPDVASPRAAKPHRRHGLEQRRSSGGANTEITSSSSSTKKTGSSGNLKRRKSGPRTRQRTSSLTSIEKAKGKPKKGARARSPRPALRRSRSAAAAQEDQEDLDSGSAPASPAPITSPLSRGRALTDDQAAMPSPSNSVLPMASPSSVFRSRSSIMVDRGNIDDTVLETAARSIADQASMDVDVFDLLDPVTGLASSRRQSMQASTDTTPSLLDDDLMLVGRRCTIFESADRGEDTLSNSFGAMELDGLLSIYDDDQGLPL